MKASAPRANVIGKIEMQKKMVAFISSALPAPSVMQVAEHFGLCKSTTVAYLYELDREGKIHRMPGPQCLIAPGRPYVVWHVGPGEGWVEDGARMDPIVTPSQKTVRTYAPHYVRDSLVAALFGAAQQ